MFELPLSSEITGLINFIVCEIMVMAYVMYVSSMVAGSLNYERIAKGGDLQLRVFDFPHIGGGLVMNRSRARSALIFLRLSTLVAIAISNFGLEGRTRTVTVYQEALVRRPGRLNDIVNDVSKQWLFNATERQMRCAQTVGEELMFGAVLDGVCYPKLSNDVHIKSIALSFEIVNITAVNCTITPGKRLYTIFSCRNVDMTCLGRFTGAEDETIEPGRCESVVYDGEFSFLCQFQSPPPGSVNAATQCRRMRAVREDIHLWPYLHVQRTPDLETAVFGAAYRLEERKLVSIPKGDKNVTNVTLFWFIPAVYQIAMLWVVTLWAAVLACRGARNVAHDEKGLTRLLQRRVDMGMVRVADWLPQSESVSRFEEPAVVDNV